MRIIGLTGGIAAGKSTVAALFRRAGVPVFDADHCVRILQEPHGRALPAIAAAFPGAVRNDVLDRDGLRSQVIGRPDRMRCLEDIIHPLVRKDRSRFLRLCRRRGCPFCVLDIPLLMETGQDRDCDHVIVVTASRSTRLSRLRRRSRQGERMNLQQAKVLMDRQMDDRERRRRADIVIRTGLSRGEAARQVHVLLKRLREGA